MSTLSDRLNDLTGAHQSLAERVAALEARTDALLDKEEARILAMPADQLAAEMRAAGLDPDEEVAKMRAIITKQLDKHGARQTPSFGCAECSWEGEAADLADEGSCPNCGTCGTAIGEVRRHIAEDVILAAASKPPVDEPMSAEEMIAAVKGDSLPPWKRAKVGDRSQSQIAVILSNAAPHWSDAEVAECAAEIRALFHPEPETPKDETDAEALFDLPALAREFGWTGFEDIETWTRHQFVRSMQWQLMNVADLPPICSTSTCPNYGSACFEECPDWPKAATPSSLDALKAHYREGVMNLTNAMTAEEAMDRAHALGLSEQVPLNVCSGECITTTIQQELDHARGWEAPTGDVRERARKIVLSSRADWRMGETEDYPTTVVDALASAGLLASKPETVRVTRAQLSAAAERMLLLVGSDDPPEDAEAMAEALRRVIPGIAIEGE